MPVSTHECFSLHFSSPVGSVGQRTYAGTPQGPLLTSKGTKGAAQVVLHTDLVPLQIFTGWVVTILFACAICSLFVALGVNSPNRHSIDQINDAQEVRSTYKHRMRSSVRTVCSPAARSHLLPGLACCCLLLWCLVSC
jgi:hypothetical protein